MYSSRILPRSLLFKQGLLPLSSSFSRGILLPSSTGSTSSSRTTGLPSSFPSSSSLWGIASSIPSRSSSSSSVVDSLSLSIFPMNSRLINNIVSNSKHTSSLSLSSRSKTFIRRTFATTTSTTKDEKSSSSSSESTKPKDKKVKDEEEEEEVYETAEPLVARVSRIIWRTIQLSFGIGIISIIFYAGYTIITTLLPMGASSNAIMRKASDIVLNDPDVHHAFGVSKTYGLDPGGHAEGRRYFVPEYKYDDPITGDPYHRVKFTLEGERGKKAWVFAEVAASTYDFRYLLVAAKDGSRVVSIIDRRPTPLTTEERQSRITSLLQNSDFTFFTDNEIDYKEQSKHLSSYWLKVKCIRCDEQPLRCQEAGITTTPVWKITNGTLVKGIKNLDDLEKLVIPLAREKDGKNKKGWFSGWFS